MPVDGESRGICAKTTYKNRLSARISGLTKQEYIIRRLTDREITVVGNPRVYKALRDQMKLIYQELQRLAVDEEVPPDLLETLQMVALTLNGLKEECE